MNASVQFEKPEEEAKDGKKAARQTMAGASRRLWPVFGAVCASLIWLGFGLYIAWQEGLLAGRVTLGLVELSAVLGGFFSFLAFFWLVALVLQRTDPLLERRLAIAGTLDKALAPVEAAELKLAHLSKALAKNLESLEAATDLAQTRIEKLEKGLQSSVGELFSAAADAEAKSATVRDRLKAEREALNTINADVESRAETLAASLASLSERAQALTAEAEDRLGRASAQLQNAGQQMGHQAEAASDRLEAASGRIVTETDDMARRAEQAEDRLDALTAALDSAATLLKTRIEGLDDTANQVSSTLSDQAKVIADLAEQAQNDAAALRETLADSTNDLAAAADGAMARASETTGQLSDQAEAMTQSLNSAADSILDRVRKLGADIGKQIETAGAASDTAAERALENSREAAAAIEVQAQELERLLKSTFAMARQEMEEASNSALEESRRVATDNRRATDEALADIQRAQAAIQDQLEALANATIRTGESMDERAGLIREQLQAQAAALEDSVAGVLSELERKGMGLADQASLISSAAKDAADNLRAAGEQMDARGENLGQAMEESRRRLEQLEADIAAKQASMTDVGAAANVMILQAVRQMVDQTDRLRASAGDVTATLQENSQAIGEEIDRLRGKGLGAVEELTAARAELAGQGEALMAALAASNEGITAAGGTLSRERRQMMEDTEKSIEAMAKAADLIEAKLQQLASGGEMGGRIIEAADQFEARAGRVSEAASRAIADTEKAGSQLEERLSGTMARGVKEAGQTMDRLSTMFAAEIRGLQDRVSAHIDKSLSALKYNAEEAGEASSRLADQLQKEADRLVNRAHNFLAKTEEIDRRIAANSSDEFVRTSSLLIDSLNAASVDINKVLDSDVPDDVWQRYLNGDRSIFSRRIVRLGTSSMRATIRRKFDRETEFRDTVLKFFRDFESLMEQVMTRDRSSAMSVSLISSDMGKLYVFLGQSLKKLK